VAVMRSLSLSFATLLAGAAYGRPMPPAPPAPLSRANIARLRAADPARLARLIAPRPSGLAMQEGRLPAVSPWAKVPHAALPNPGAMLLLTDGSVMIQDQGPNNSGTGNWWKLTPDTTGNYANGAWTQLASMPSGYAPLYDAEAVLPDGRVIVEGGEYNNGNLVWTNLGAIYDPVANAWTAVAPPDGGTGQWVRIGDGPGTVLANGTFFFGASGYSGTTVEALLNAAALTFSDTGTGKADGNGEEGWSLLPSGGVLTVDTDNSAAPLNSELYNPATGSWASAGNTPQQLSQDGEIGPQLTRPNGTVLAVGASGHNAVYTAATGTWSAAPDFPVIKGLHYDEADGPGAVLPDGNVLLMASPGEYNVPSHFYLFNGTRLTSAGDTPNAGALSSFYGFMLVLPTGQVLFNDRVGGMWTYTSTGKAKTGYRPVVQSVPKSVAAGASYTVKGKQLSGLAQGAAYGDDYQSATNYPLVRLVITATGDVFYARTTGITSNAVAPGAAGSATFTVPAGIETGPATLYVVANGVASAGKAVTITP